MNLLSNFALPIHQYFRGSLLISGDYISTLMETGFCQDFSSNWG